MTNNIKLIILILYYNIKLIIFYDIINIIILYTICNILLYNIDIFA